MRAEPSVSSLPGLQDAERLLDLLPTGIVLIEPETARVLYANREAHRLAGGALPFSDGATDYATLYPSRDPEGRPVASEDMPGPRLARREPFSRMQLDWTTPAGVRTIVASGELTRLGDGTEVGVITFEDVTALEDARRRARLLSDAGARLSRSLELEQTLQTIAEVAVPAFADWCFVELTRPHGIDRAVIAHRDPSRRTFVEEYARRYPLDPDSPVGSPAVIRTGEPMLIREVTEEMLAAAAPDPEQLRLLRSAGFASSVIVPLRVRGEVIGDLALAVSDSARRYDEADLSTVQELADRCAMAIDNARLHGELREAERQARVSRDEVWTILRGVPDAVTAQTPDGRVVYANPAALERLGYPSLEALAAAPVDELRRRFEFTDGEGRSLPVERLPGRQALLGQEPEPLLVRHRSPHDGELRWARVQATAIPGEDGAPRLAVNVVEDVTDIKRAEEGYRFLAEASQVLSDSLDYEETLRTVAELAVPRVADWCGVDLWDGERLDRVAVAHVDPARVTLARELQARYPQGTGSAIHQVIATGQPALFRDITDKMLADGAHDEEHLRIVRTLGMRSVVIVPMTVRDRVLGAITFVSAEAGRRFDEQDVALAQDLGLRAAAAIDNARLYEASAAIAHTLQASLLPPHLPEVPGAELAAVYRPAGRGIDVGGDFYDVFNVAEDQWYLVMGDVCGKGPAAAAITALARYTIRAAAVRRRSPSAILRWLNDAMLRQGETDGRFCTIACAHLDLSRPTVRTTVCCGGHPAPIVLRPDGATEELGVPGTLLGLVADPDLQDRSTELRPGDALVAYTDGLTEADAPRRVWTGDELRASLSVTAGRDAAAITAHLVGEVLGGVTAPRDDVAVLALRMLPEP